MSLRIAVDAENLLSGLLCCRVLRGSCNEGDSRLLEKGQFEEVSGRGG